jgi:peptidyl-prolyl cis-trans isomerase C
MTKFANLLVATAFSLSLGGQAFAQEDVTADTLLAIVNDTPITLGHAIAMRAALPPQFQSLPDDTLFLALVEQLVEQTALAQSVDGQMSRRDQLSLENETRNFSANVALTAATQSAVTDEALTIAYGAFVEEFSGQEPIPEYNAAHILVATEAEAIALRALIEGGEAFADVARANSTDGAAANGGDLGWFGPGMMIPAFEAAVMALEIDEVSQPVETQFGWHLVLLNDSRVSQAPTMDDVRDQLAEEIQRETARVLIETVAGQATITRLFEEMDPAILSRTDLLDE